MAPLERLSIMRMPNKRMPIDQVWIAARQRRRATRPTIR
jgi:hypothetical protein